MVERKIADTVLAAKVHLHHVLAARRAYNDASKHGHFEPLTPSTKRVIKDYAEVKLGSAALYGPWLSVYALVRGRFEEGLMPDNFYAVKVLPRINHKYRTVSGARTLIRRLFDSDVVPDVAYRVNGHWRTVEGVIIPLASLRSHLFRDSDEVIVKDEGSSQGSGVNLVRRSDFDPEKLGTENLTVQRFIRQHSELESVSPNCVATLRITTGIMPEGSIRRVSSHMRLGMSGDAIVMSARALKCPIVDDNGSLSEFAYGPDWFRYAKHPDTGRSFSSVAAPSHSEAVKICETLHARLPQFGIIGWDVAISEEGAPLIMEWNAVHPDIKFAEATMGPKLQFLDAYLT